MARPPRLLLLPATILVGAALAASGAAIAQDPAPVPADPAPAAADPAPAPADPAPPPANRPPGQVLFEAQACHTCHSVPAAGLVKVGDPTLTAPDLENLDDEYSRRGLKRWLKRTKMHDGMTHLQMFHGTDEDLDLLVRWLLEP